VSASYSVVHSTQGKGAIGFSLGVGVDYALYQNVFLRGEFEYLQFGDIGHGNSNSTSLLNLNAMSLRTGLGMKF
ncbi:MAG TPA: outer membrane beta-barrel protein, partial [Xanthobacteraceae bacterium]|nr:outer membrane beta-barrel protein [Xanthobacteraceae bacterium]